MLGLTNVDGGLFPLFENTFYFPYIYNIDISFLLKYKCRNCQNLMVCTNYCINVQVVLGFPRDIAVITRF